MTDEQALCKVALRYRAVFLNIEQPATVAQAAFTPSHMAFVATLRQYGYTVSEDLLHALPQLPDDRLQSLSDVIGDVLGINLNWMPLVKGWQVPTGATPADYFLTFLANASLESRSIQCSEVNGERLPCGHFIPDGTFPLERYNGCPFCGTPFHSADYVYKGQGSKLKELRLCTVGDMKRLLRSLLVSAVPLDATQTDSLELLLQQLPLPAGVDIPMKETRLLVTDMLVKSQCSCKAPEYPLERKLCEAPEYPLERKAGQWSMLITSPADILRYLWFAKTGLRQVVEPRLLVAKAAKSGRHHWEQADRQQQFADDKRQQLRLRYGRSFCRLVAVWLNTLDMPARQAAADMNTHRGMWVRFIHALRLGEYSRKPGFERLAELLDVFYRHDYTTWTGRLDYARRQNDADTVLAMLADRPGLFARCLFSTMLRYGSDRALAAFVPVSHQLPSRLVLSLGNAADAWFDINRQRTVRPVTGGIRLIAPHPLLAAYTEAERLQMAAAVRDLYACTMRYRFSVPPGRRSPATIYIAPALYNIPVSVGDRSASIQDTSCALQGTRFPVLGDAVRLFLHWGKGLKAQPLDMDLSCEIAMADGTKETCAYYNLVATGTKHSGDIRSIPDYVGTAEYIELSLSELQQAGAKYVTFTCNAYSAGALSPNLMLGWMDSAYPMQVSEETGVAYDPSCVQHIVRISEENLSKGLVFGVLRVESRDIVWLEMPFDGQTVCSLNSDGVMQLLRRLEEKLTIGQLLDIKCEAQNLTRVDSPDDADEAYTYEWALNPAALSEIL